MRTWSAQKAISFLIGNFSTKSVPGPSITRGVGTRGAADRQHLNSNHRLSMCPPQPLLSRQSYTHTTAHLKLVCSQHLSCQNTAAYRRLAGVVKPAQEVGQIFQQLTHTELRFTVATLLPFLEMACLKLAPGCLNCTAVTDRLTIEINYYRGST